MKKACDLKDVKQNFLPAEKCSYKFSFWRYCKQYINIHHLKLSCVLGVEIVLIVRIPASLCGINLLLLFI